MTLSQDILKKINPPLDMSTFEEVEVMLADPACITLCLRSTFAFMEKALLDIVARNIQGDLIIAGVWRGGLATYIQALLAEHGQTHRKLYLADTFKGFLQVSDEHPNDKKMFDYFATLGAPTGSSAEVMQRFRNWGLPVDNVILLGGDVKKTTADFGNPLALLAIDVDFYAPTYDSIHNLYAHVVSNGYIYVDDYGVEEYECRQAVDTYIREHNLHVDIRKVNKFGVYWQK